MQLGMPTGIMAADGAMQLTAADDARRTITMNDTKTKKKGCC